MKKSLIAVLILLCMLTAAAFAEEAVATEGTPEPLVCGSYTYELLEDGTAKIVKYDGNDEFLTVPAELDGVAVTVIGSKAFDSTKAKSITLSEGITALEEDAFYFARMTRLTLPDSLTVFGENPISSCNYLDTVVLSDTNTALKLEDRALIAVEDQRLLTILWCRYGSMPFNQTEYTVPDGVRIIGKRAFYSNETIQTLLLPDTVCEIGKYAFYGNKSLVTVAFYESAVGSEAERTGLAIGDDAFFICSALENVAIPSDFTAIGDSAFYRCTSLKTVDLPAALESIGGLAFYGCESLEEAILPDGFKTVGFSAFDGCVSLKKLRLPASLEKIGRDAFNGCEKLQTIRTSINVTDNMCSGMTGLKIVEIAEGVQTIGRNAFKGCTSLEKITLPFSLMSIDSTAFEGCEGYSFVVPAGSYAEEYAKYYGIPYTVAE